MRRISPGSAVALWRLAEESQRENDRASATVLPGGDLCWRLGGRILQGLTYGRMRLRCAVPAGVLAI